MFSPISRDISGEGNGRKGDDAEKALSSLGHRLRMSSDVLAQRGGMAESPKSPSPSPSSVGLSVGPSVGAARTIPQRAFLISTLAEKEGRKERKRKRKRKSERDSGRRQCVSVQLFCHGFFMASQSPFFCPLAALAMLARPRPRPPDCHKEGGNSICAP